MAFITVVERDHPESMAPLPGTSARWVRIDDATDRDRPGMHCQMLVNVLQGRKVLMDIWRLPLNDETRLLISELGGRLDEVPGGIKVTLELPWKGSPSRIRKLAKSIRRVVGRGQRYPDSNWKWICPRTADSLERFAKDLEKKIKVHKAFPWRR